jgi:hypothetical protein
VSGIKQLLSKNNILLVNLSICFLVRYLEVAFRSERIVEIIPLALSFLDRFELALNNLVSSIDPYLFLYL